MLVQALNICFLTGKSTQFATLATAGGVPTAQWMATLPFAVVAAAGALYGVRVRSRIDAPTYRRWLVRALLAIALVLCAQYRDTQRLGMSIAQTTAALRRKTAGMPAVARSQPRPLRPEAPSAARRSGTSRS